MYCRTLLALVAVTRHYYFLKSDYKNMENTTTFYVQGLGNISPQKTFDNNEFLNEISEYNDNVLPCVLPEFKNYIHPVALRRMSRLLRIGLSAARRGIDLWPAAGFLRNRDGHLVCERARGIRPGGAAGGPGCAGGCVECLAE